MAWGLERSAPGGVPLSVQPRPLDLLHTPAVHDREEAGRRRVYAAVDVDECLWSLDEEELGGEAVRILMITLARPELTEEEITWKKGQGMDQQVVRVALTRLPGEVHDLAAMGGPWPMQAGLKLSLPSRYLRFSTPRPWPSHPLLTQRPTAGQPVQGAPWDAGPAGLPLLHRG